MNTLFIGQASHTCSAALFITLSLCFAVCLTTQMFYQLTRNANGIRAALIAAIYGKALRYALANCPLHSIIHG